MRIAAESDATLGISAGDVLGEYFSSPAGRANNPSRTTVDAFGNIWVGNRDESSGGKGSVTRFGLVIGGERGDKVPDGGGGFTFVPNPLGDYLQGPFKSCTCDDRDGDGLIKTSRGYARSTGQFNVDYVNTTLPWTNLPGGVDDNGGVVSAEDECITAYIRTEGTGVRHLSFDANNDLWVGGRGNRRFEKLDNATTAQVPGSVFDGLGVGGVDVGGYGGILDPCGILWSATWGGSLLRYDTNTGLITSPAIQNYGVAFDAVTGLIWTDSYTSTIASRFPSSASPVTTFSHNSANFNRGMVVHNSEVWIANSGGATVSRFTTSGAPVGSGTLNVSYLGSPPVPGNNPHGLVVDSAGKIWAVNRTTHNATRIDPTTGPMGTVDLAVDLGPNAFPYNYSDMSGDQLLKIAPQGSWTFIHDGGMPDCEWETVDWAEILTGGSEVIVRVRAGNSALPSGPWTTVMANTPFAGVVGQYIQVQVTLKRGISRTPEGCFPFPTGEAILCDFTVCKKAPCSVDVASVVCDLDGSGDLTASLVIYNNSGVDARRVLITATSPGNPLVIPNPNNIPLNIPNGSSATLDVSFSGLFHDAELCFIVTLLDASGQDCCSIPVCFTPDCNCVQIRDENYTVLCSPDGETGSYLFTFEFDNLTPDTIHHIYFNPPPGVTIGTGPIPNYVRLTQPVAPHTTSNPIMVMVTGATPGQKLTFEMSIHDENLVECCTSELCIDLPVCMDGAPVGACCYERPGVPQTLCTVTTEEECLNILAGVYQGDNSVCTPSPCTPPPAQTAVHLTNIVNCCPGTQFVTMTLTINNNSTALKNYSFSIASVTGVGCPNSINPSFISPNAGTVGLLPGGSVSIPITVHCEGTLGQSVISCLDATVTDQSTGLASVARGQIRTITANPGDPLPSWCFNIFFPDPGFSPSGPVPVAFGSVGMGTVTVSNLRNVAGALSYEVVGGGPLQINGGLPGSGIFNYVTAEPGQSVDVAFEVSFAEHAPGQVFDVIFFADLLGDGQRTPVASLAYRSFDPANCLGDTNGDGAINFADLNAVLSCYGVSGGACLAGDVNDDGLVDFADLNIVLSNFGTGCN